MEPRDAVVREVCGAQASIQQKSTIMRVDWQHLIEDHQWLGLLRPFIFVKNLYVSKELVPSIVSGLQELIGDRTKVLPILQNIFLEGPQPLGPVQEGIGQFVAARELTRHPITVSFEDSILDCDRYPELLLYEHHPLSVL